MSKKMMVLFLTLVLCLGVSLAARAAENSVTAGWSGMMFTLEYERQIFEQSTIYLDYGSALDLTGEGSCGYALGMKWYFKDQVLDGGYLGLGYSKIDYQGGDFLWFELDPETNTFLTLALGYKKAFGSGFTFEAGLQYLYYLDPAAGDPDGGASFALALGYSW